MFFLLLSVILVYVKSHLVGYIQQYFYKAALDGGQMLPEVVEVGHILGLGKISYNED